MLSEVLDSLESHRTCLLKEVRAFQVLDPQQALVQELLSVGWCAVPESCLLKDLQLPLAQELLSAGWCAVPESLEAQGT